MIDRLSVYIGFLGISVRAFEISISASNGLIRKAIANNTDIQSKWLSVIVDNYPQLNIYWLLTGEGEMLKSQVASPVPQTHTIYIDNPDKDEIISLQRDKIKLLDRQLTMTEAKLKQFELLNLEDARFGAAHGVVEPTSATSERAIDDFMLRKNQS